MNKDLSIIIPIFNEKKNIELLVNDIYKKLKKINFEIIFVDDDSQDGSHEVLNKLKLKKKANFLIRKSIKKDLTQSCFIGIEKSKFETILIMDGDLQHDPKYINKMINILYDKNMDIVIGARNFKEKNLNRSLTYLRIIASKTLKLFINIFLGIKTTDPLTGFFIFKKRIYKKNKKKFYGQGYKILADFIYSDKLLKITEIKINFKKRIHGNSKMDLNVLILFIKFFFKKVVKKIFT